MNVAIWLLTALLALPLAEIVAFVLVAAWIGFSWAALALIGTSLAGALMLRRGGGAHVSRMRVVLGSQRMTALETDTNGTMYLLGAVLLLIPGFITDAIGIVVLVPPLRRAIGALLLRRFAQPRQRDDVVDLDPHDWKREADPKLRDHRDERR